MEDVALQEGYNVFLCNTNYEVQRGHAFVRSLINKQVDGVLIMSSSMSDEWVTELAAQGIPVVLLDWKISSVDGVVGTISVDFEIGIHQAVDHLVQLGHRRFAHIAGPLHLRTSQARRDAFLKALTHHGIASEQVHLIEGNLRIDGGRKALKELLQLQDRPTALFAANDLTALYGIFPGSERIVRNCFSRNGFMMAAMLSAPGVIGARQAGAGFGGCMVAFVEKDQVARFAGHVYTGYWKNTGIEPVIFSVNRFRIY